MSTEFSGLTLVSRCSELLEMVQHRSVHARTGWQGEEWLLDRDATFL